MKKVKISTNEFAVDAQIDALKSLKNECDKFIPHFNDLGIGSLTTELLSDAVLNGCAKIASIASQQAQNDIKTIKSPSIRQVMLEGVRKAVSAFKQELLTTLQGENRSLAKYLIVKNGSIELMPEAVNLIIEQNTYYIENQEEFDVYNAHLAACEAINNFVNLLEIKPPHIAGLFKLFPDHAEPVSYLYSSFFTSKK